MIIIQQESPDKYVELLCFEVEVMNILQTRKYGKYELNEEEKVPIIRKWLGREILQ